MVYCPVTGLPLLYSLSTVALSSLYTSLKDLSLILLMCLLSFETYTWMSNKETGMTQTFSLRIFVYQGISGNYEQTLRDQNQK